MSIAAAVQAEEETTMRLGLDRPMMTWELLPWTKAAAAAAAAVILFLMAPLSSFSKRTSELWPWDFSPPLPRKISLRLIINEGGAQKRRLF